MMRPVTAETMRWDMWSANLASPEGMIMLPLHSGHDPQAVLAPSPDNNRAGHQHQEH